MKIATNYKWLNKFQEKEDERISFPHRTLIETFIKKNPIEVRIKDGNSKSGSN